MLQHSAEVPILVGIYHSLPTEVLTSTSHCVHYLRCLIQFMNQYGVQLEFHQPS